MKKSVMCIVETQGKAEFIVDQVVQAGFPRSDVSVLLPSKSGTKDFAHEHNTKAPEGAVAGVSAGGAVGGTLGLLAGIGALAIPGLGPFIAAGPLLAALSGAAAGAAVGGITGALIGMGIPEMEAKRYEGKIKGGNILISVHANSGDEQKRIEVIFKNNGAYDIVSASESSVPDARRPPSNEYQPALSPPSR
ncbi:MAG: hypothetical protein Q8L14_04930 [Myxococcales bacterium]|nr:hypothetical protein [Myxococcales bacterium]